MNRRRWGEQGFAMIAVLSVMLVLTVLSLLVLHVTGKEVRLGGVRRLGAQSIYLAEGGANAGRAGLMALLYQNPSGPTPSDPTGQWFSVHDSLNETILESNLYAAGNPSTQNALGLLDYLVVDGQRFTLGTTSATEWQAFYTDWSQPYAHRKLVAGPGGSSPLRTAACTPAQAAAVFGTPPLNTLGPGTYRATVVLCPRLAAHPSDPGQPARYVQKHVPGVYEFFYSYMVVSDGQTEPTSRRRVVLTGDFSIIVQRQTFAQFALFTHVHTTPSGGAIWFTDRTSFDGPVHTNGEFRFAFFPKFSDRVTSAGCTNAACTNTDRDYAWFNNLGSSRRLRANENVVSGTRRDAPVQFDSTPTVYSDDNDNAPANFTRGAARITIPPSSYNQRAITLGIDPADTSPNSWTSSQWNSAIRSAVPELANSSSSVPNAIYVPVVDANGNGVSDPNEALGGGIYVQGDLTSLTFSVSGPTNNLAVYTFVAGSQTVTMTVDRAAGTTTINNTCWNPEAGCTQSGSRTFVGVPKGWQGDPTSNTNSTVIWVNGNIAGSSASQGLSGTLEEKEQTTVAASGRIDIVNHIRYEDPPNVSDPNDNPLNVLGIYSTNGDIRITTAAPNDLVIHAVLMAGQPGARDCYTMSCPVVTVDQYNSGSPRGLVQLIGGLIEEEYGAFGTFNSSTGAVQTGYGRDFKYDRRLARGILPPFFPTTTRFELAEGSGKLAGVKPVWRESTP